MDAVISAIRRYKLDYHTPIFDKASELIKKTDSVSIKSGLVCMFLIYELEYDALLSKLFSAVDIKHKDVLRIIQSEKYLIIIVDAKNLEKIKALFHTEKNNKIFRNLAEFNITIDPAVHRTPGLISLLTTELAINSINIVEIIGSYKEILLYLEEKDMVKAHKVIHYLCHI
jgi:aspartokinase